MTTISGRGIYLLNKLIAYQQQVDIVREELRKVHGIEIPYIEDRDVYVADGIENFGVPCSKKRVRNHKVEEGFLMNGMFVFTITGKDEGEEDA